MASTVSVAASPSKFEYTATGILGDKRATMLSNKLHLRNELGRSKSHGHGSTSTASITYGMPYPPSDLGVAGALIWIEPETKQQKSKSKTHSKHSSSSSPSRGYGRPVRPSTPIQDVLSFKYQDEWITRQRSAQVAKAKQAKGKKMPPGAFRENHTSELRAASKLVEVDEGPQWQMKKFSASAESQLDTFRTAEERDRAFKNQRQDTLVVS